MNTVKAYSLAALLGAALLMGQPSVLAADEQATGEAAASAVAETSTPASEKDLATGVQLMKKHYLYTSKQYGFSLLCPKKPVGVIPAAVLDPGREGDVLVFENDGYTLNKAWIIWVNAFEDKAMPDLTKTTPEEEKKLKERLAQANGYSQVEIVPMAMKSRAVIAITSKELSFDTNGDGQPDQTAIADNQMADLWFRGNKGGRFFARLIDNPTLSQENLAEFKAGVSAFWEN